MAGKWEIRLEKVKEERNQNVNKEAWQVEFNYEEQQPRLLYEIDNLSNGVTNRLNDYPA